MSDSTEKTSMHPHKAMRRKDREITDRNEIDEIIRSTNVMHLALSSDSIPFVVPLFYVYDGGSLYFHSAKAGTKIDIIKKNNRACFEITVDHGIIPDNNACDFEAKHRTVIGLGSVYFVEDLTEKKRILQRIIGRFSDKTFDLPDARVNNTIVARIDFDSIKGKKHGF